MASHHKKLTPGSIQSNKFLSDIPEKRAKIEASIAFRNNTLQAQKRANYQNEFDRLTGYKEINYNLIQAKVGKEKSINDALGQIIIKNTQGKPSKVRAKRADMLQKQLATIENEKNIITQRAPVLEKRMKELTTKATKSLTKGKEPHPIYKTNF